jgi:serine/threonine protein kinase
VVEPSPRLPRVTDAALERLRVVLDEPDLTATRYEIGVAIGRGGMGTVWSARDLELCREVALKVLDEPVPEVAGVVAERLLAEARVLARLEHPGIVPVHDVGTLPDGRVWYAMKRVRGARLDELLARGLADGEKHRIFARIAETVAFAHSRGVIHRDLKPQNVMAGEFGEVLVLDWGLAVAMDGAARETAGTPGFMAPEQAGGGAVDARADVFSLGRTLEALWPGGSRAERDLRPLRAIVERACATDRADRYAGVADLAADVARWRDGAAVVALPERWPHQLVRHYRRYRAAYWLIGTYVALRVAFELARQRFR